MTASGQYLEPSEVPISNPTCPKSPTGQKGPTSPTPPQNDIRHPTYHIRKRKNKPNGKIGNLRNAHPPPSISSILPPYAISAFSAFSAVNRKTQNKPNVKMGKTMQVLMEQAFRGITTNIPPRKTNPIKPNSSTAIRHTTYDIRYTTSEQTARRPELRRKPGPPKCNWDQIVNTS